MGQLIHLKLYGMYFLNGDLFIFILSIGVPLLIQPEIFWNVDHIHSKVCILYTHQHSISFGIGVWDISIHTFTITKFAHQIHCSYSWILLLLVYVHIFSTSRSLFSDTVSAIIYSCVNPPEKSHSKCWRIENRTSM